MIDARFRPLPKWIRKPPLGDKDKDFETYKKPQFRTAYNRTLDLLELELKKLGARDILIEAGFALEQLRNDGWPKGGTRPAHPGVVLYFKSPEGAMEFPCGTYANFEANLHAIALTLENLRAIDRYGVTLGHQQYAGFLALPPAPKEWTVEQAADFVATHSAMTAGVMIEDGAVYRTAYKQAAARLHPDVTGSNDMFHMLGRAKAVLDRHHNLKSGSERA